MAQELLIRRAEIDDVVSFNALVSSLGRVPLFRAIFGAFNYSNIVEYSHLSLIASCGSDAEAVGFVSITDTSTLDSLTFDGAIKELKQYVQVEVRKTLLSSPRSSYHHNISFSHRTTNYLCHLLLFFIF